MLYPRAQGMGLEANAPSASKSMNSSIVASRSFEYISGDPMYTVFKSMKFRNVPVLPINRTGNITKITLTKSDDAIITSKSAGTRKLRSNESLIKSRACAGIHAMAQCPLGSKPDNLANDLPRFSLANRTGALASKYIPPAQRMELEGNASSASMSMRIREDLNTIRVTNLPGEMQEDDIRDLFQRFGRISRIFLARGKYTAFVWFDYHDQAVEAVHTLNGFGYANLILKVELRKFYR